MVKWLQKIIAKILFKSRDEDELKQFRLDVGKKIEGGRELWMGGLVWSQLEFCQYWERELNNLWPDGNLGGNRSGQIFSYCSFPPYWIDNDNGWYLILKFFTFLPYTDILSLNRTDVFSFNLKNQFPSKFQWSFSKWQSRVFPLLPKIVLCKYSE